MTQEEKAKRYEQTLERAREAKQNTESAVTIGILEEIFPELRESEDEKIKKTLIDYFITYKKQEECGIKTFFGIPTDNVIAWLEKQCEQKPFDYENANIQQKDFASKEVIPRYNIGDVLCDKSCTTLNKEEQPNFEITDIRNGMYICDKCSFPISQQDEYELVAKRIEQKPWSEEDEEMLSEIITDIKSAQSKYPDSQMNQIIIEEEVHWLKSIKERIGG